MNRIDEEIGDSQCPREHGRYTKIIRRLLFGYGIVLWLFLFQLCSCSPIVTSPHGYIIHIDSIMVSVEHERIDKPGYGVVRYYPFEEGFELGDYYNVKTKKPLTKD